MERTFDASGARNTDTMKLGRRRAFIGWVLVATAATQLCYSLDMNVQGLQLLPDDALSHAPAHVLHQKPHTAVLREREGVETHTLPPIEDPQCADRDSENFRGGRDNNQLLSL